MAEKEIAAHHVLGTIRHCVHAAKLPTDAQEEEIEQIHGERIFYAMACFCTFTVYVLNPDPDSYLSTRIWIRLLDPRIRIRVKFTYIEML